MTPTNYKDLEEELQKVREECYRWKDAYYESNAMMHVILRLTGHKEEFLDECARIMNEQKSFVAAYRYASEHPMDHIFK